MAKEGERMVATWLPLKEAKRIEQQAAREGRSVAAVVRLALASAGYLNRAEAAR